MRILASFLVPPIISFLEPSFRVIFSSLAKQVIFLYLIKDT